MSYEVWLSYLDEEDIKRNGYVELVHLDSSFIKFKTKGNLITLPTVRILKMKEKLGSEYEKRDNEGRS